MGKDLLAFPPCLTKFRNLTQLSLHFGEGSLERKVPESIGALTSLRHLNLSSDYRISLPDYSFSKLTTLEELWINAPINKEDIAPVRHLTGLT